MNASYKIGWHCFRALFRFYFRWRVCNPERVPAVRAGHSGLQSRQFS